MAAVELAQAHQPSQDVGQVGAEHAAIGVNLVNDDVAQVLEQLDPLGVMGQDAGVEHVRVGHHDVPCLPHRPPGRAGGVPVVGVGLDIHTHLLDELVQLAHLVGGEGLGGEQVQRPGVLVAQDGGEHRQVVAHGLARSRGCDHHHVLPPEDRLHRGGLVAVQLMHAPLLQHGPQPFVQPRREGRVLRGPRRQHLPAHHILHEHGILPELLRQLINVHDRTSPCRRIVCVLL